MISQKRLRILKASVVVVHKINVESHDANASLTKPSRILIDAYEKTPIPASGIFRTEWELCQHLLLVVVMVPVAVAAKANGDSWPKNAGRGGHNSSQRH